MGEGSALKRMGFILWGTTMSRRNGDKARFGRQRKEQIHRREKIRELRKGMTKGGQAAVKPKSD